MNEIIFIVKESPEGGFEGRALGHSIFVEGETYGELKENIRDAIHCHFETDAPRIVRIHFTGSSSLFTETQSPVSNFLST